MGIHHSFFRLAFLFSVALLFCAASAQAQTSIDDIHVVPRNDPTAEPPEPAVPTVEDLKVRQFRPLRFNVDLVLVPVTVTDVLNHPVMGLQQKNFTLFEDEHRQQLEYFSDEDAPISIGLVLDLSKSMENKFTIEREAVEQFFNNANPQDDYFVVTFSDRPRVLASSSQSLDDIQQKLSAEIPDGQTALLDAVYLAVSRMHNARYRRRALLIVSDGGDNHSRYGLGEIKSLVEEADMQVYAIGIFDSIIPFRSFEEFMGKRWLSEITDATGGRTVTADNLTKVPEIAAAISREMRNQYVLGYKPEKDSADGRWRKIRVKVTPPDTSTRVQAYYKKGYTAPKK